MKRTLILLSMLALAGVLVISGCSKETTGTDPIDDGLNYEDEFGGYDASDEAPGFGDEVILGDMTEEDEIPTPDIELGPILDSIGNVDHVRVFGMKILWGMLEFDSTVTEATDWSGSLTIDRGGIRMVSLIRFERGDEVIRPRTDRQMVEWVSYTQPHFDGIFVLLYDCPDMMTEVENTVTFTTGPYTRTFTMAELESLSEIVEVDDIGNKVSFDAFYAPRLECQFGNMEGRWVKKGPQNGVIYGRWMSADGHFLGHLRGHWGTNSSNGKVFFGKWISNLGQFRGLIRGTWGVGDATDAADPLGGWYEGVWADRNGVVQGVLGGQWTAVPNTLDDGNGSGTGNRYENDGDRYGGDTGGIPERGHGFFSGRWAQNCPEE